MTLRISTSLLLLYCATSIPNSIFPVKSFAVLVKKCTMANYHDCPGVSPDFARTGSRLRASVDPLVQPELSGDSLMRVPCKLLGQTGRLRRNLVASVTFDGTCSVLALSSFWPVLYLPNMSRLGIAYATKWLSGESRPKIPHVHSSTVRSPARSFCITAN